MEPNEDGSAPGRVDALRPRWRELPASDRERLALKWCDHCVRGALADLAERSGAGEQAQLLRSLPPISELGTLVRAHAVVRHLTTGESMDGHTFSACLTAVVFLAGLEQQVEIGEAAFFTVMTSRFAYGDDRLIAMMERDLPP